MPVAVVDNVATGSPVIYFVHVDHLMRPARMTAAGTNWVWDVIYAPFGAVSYIWTNPETMDIRFPGQWYQLESGLAYNWHRHYDATIGRYVQPDPLLKDAKGPTIAGLPTGTAVPKLSLLDVLVSSQMNKSLPALTAGLGVDATSAASKILFADGPAIYGYSTQSPLVQSDRDGLQPKDKYYGLPPKFWNWYHRFEKSQETQTCLMTKLARYMMSGAGRVAR